MPEPLQGLLHTSQLSSATVNTIFGLAKQFQKLEKNGQDWRSCLNIPERRTWLSFYFLEPSTRTRHSFEAAASRLGISVSICEGGAISSASKGESPAETFHTLNAMGPDLFVVRSNEKHDLLPTLEASKTPVISAGTGSLEHPTQALLDTFTLSENSKLSLSEQKLLFVGDVGHSRVAGSHLKLSQILGYQIAYICPQGMEPESSEWAEIQGFKSIDEGMAWATSCMALRPQKERHESTYNMDNYSKDFCLNNERVKKLSAEGLIMHPGPYVPGEDFDLELLNDKRCVVREMVSNGVYIRASLFATLLGWSQ